MNENKKKELQKRNLNSYIRNRVQRKFLTSGTTQKYIDYCKVQNKIRKNDPNISFE